MATKGQIVEQVLRIVNGGGISDDSKVTSKEVGTLLEHERDALVRKTILENSSVGEHEIPNEFLSMLTLDVLQDTSNIYGNGGRAYSQLPQTPVNLPNDGGIYRVCKVDSDEAQARKQVIVLQSNAVAETSSDTGTTAMGWTNDLTGTYDISNKLIFSFEHGPDINNLTTRQFTFSYVDSSGVSPSKLTLTNLNPFFIFLSLKRNADFTDFLTKNGLTVRYIHTSGSNSFTFSFESDNLAQSFGVATIGNHSIKSVLTNSKVLTPGTIVPSISWSEMTADTTPVLSFGVSVDYSKNKRIYNMEADPLGIKAKDSAFLNMFISFTQRDVANYDGLSQAAIMQAWINRFGGYIKQYGLYVEKASDTTLYINETKALGGFDAVYSDDGTMGSSSSVTVSTIYPTNNGSPNYSQSYCYSRMPNPGMYSGMYDSAINLSGRKYWYRQEGRVYLYNESPFNDAADSFTNKVSSKIAVWMLAKSGELKNEDEFPMPPDAIPEVIKSLVATFTAMRTATEDLTNNNIDIS
jgi:hypothetical protein